MSKQKLPAKFLVINVDSDIIQLCNVEKKKDVVNVLNAITIKTPEFSYEDGVLKDLPNIVKAIYEALKAEKIKTREVVFSISSTKVLSKEVVIPYMASDEKVLSLIKANAGEYFPVATEDCVYAYSVLDTYETEADGKKQKLMKFIAYAVVNDIVNSRYELAKQLDLKVASVDYSGNSIAQLCSRQVGSEPTMTLVLKEESTVISTFKDKKLSMQRTVLLGVGKIIKAIAAAYSVTESGAKELMKRTSIKTIADEKPSVKEEIDEYFTSVQRIKEYYRRAFADNPLVNIYIMGEASDYLGFDDMFSSYLGLPAIQISSLNGFSAMMPVNAITPEGDSGSVLGVSSTDPAHELIRYIEVLGASIDPLGLVSKELEGQVRDKSRNNKYRLIILAAFLIAIAIVAIPLVKYLDLKSTKEDLERDIARLEIENEKVSKLRKESDRLDKYYGDLVTFDKNTFVPANYSYEFIEALESALPKECKVKTLHVKASGDVSMSFEADNYITLIKYIMQMKSIANVDDEWVNNVSIINRGTNDDNNTQNTGLDGQSLEGLAVEASCVLTPGNVFYLNSDRAADALSK